MEGGGCITDCLGLELLFKCIHLASPLKMALSQEDHRPQLETQKLLEERERKILSQRPVRRVKGEIWSRDRKRNGIPGPGFPSQPTWTFHPSDFPASINSKECSWDSRLFGKVWASPCGTLACSATFRQSSLGPRWNSCRSSWLSP